MTEQLQLFTIPTSPYRTKIIHDPYWDEITQEPEDTFLMVVDEDTIPLTTIRKRAIGDGTGRITIRSISKKGKNYKEYWYDWQYYQNGKLIGRSKYIPKRLVPQIQALEGEKVPVSKILEVLGVRS
jgi:hypothetical protein